jgi:hypothetical protein
LVRRRRVGTLKVKLTTLSETNASLRMKQSVHLCMAIMKMKKNMDTKIETKKSKAGMKTDMNTKRNTGMKTERKMGMRTEREAEMKTKTTILYPGMPAVRERQVHTWNLWTHHPQPD